MLRTSFNTCVIGIEIKRLRTGMTNRPSTPADQDYMHMHSSRVLATQNLLRVVSNTIHTTGSCIDLCEAVIRSDNHAMNELQLYTV